MNNLSLLSSRIALHRRLLNLYQKASRTSLNDSANFFAELEEISKNTSAHYGTSSLILRYERLLDLAFADGLNEKQRRQETATRLPVVLTSINPSSRTELQRRCFQRWKSLGFETYTLNHGSEMEALQNAGIEAVDILELGQEETGLDTFGKPVPRIDAVFKQAETGFHRDILLVNSDLYPAAAETSFIDTWKQNGSALGLTRQDVLSIEHPVRRIWQPYRGGIDAFLLSHDALQQLRQHLTLFPVSKRMCFGIVGWDYFVGATLMEQLDGTLIDSQVLFHEMHSPTYTDVKEFEHYLPAMQALGVGLGKDHVGAAEEFAKRINDTCLENRSAPSEEALQSLLRKAKKPDETAPIAHLEALKKRAPQLLYAFGMSYVSSLASALNARNDISCAYLFSRFPDDEKKRAFSHVLLLFVLLLRLRDNETVPLSQSYPQGNRHAEALREIRSRTADTPDVLRLELAKLFCVEFIDYGIFNPRLYNFLALSCENDGERALISEINDFLTEKTINAA